jgi:hypothetical protein
MSLSNHQLMPIHSACATSRDTAKSKFKQLFSFRGCFTAYTLLLVLTLLTRYSQVEVSTSGGSSSLLALENEQDSNKGNSFQQQQEQSHRMTTNHNSKTFDFKATTELAPTCDTLSYDKIDFTLVTQLSPNRLGIMHQHCKRWGDHPISVAVGTSSSQKAILKVLKALGCHPENLTVTIISDFDSDESYPVNRLRNAALAAVKTSHFVYVDADFVPSLHLYDELMKQRDALLHYKTAFVLPAFELNPLCDSVECKHLHEYMIPDTKQELVDLFTSPADNPAVTQFDVKGNPSGHGSTRYMDWITQDEDELLPIECMTSPRYEPYVVMRYCHDLPPFQEQFAGYGQNKITWMQQVRRSGYKFFQLGQGFLLHIPHKHSAARKAWSKEKDQAEDIYVSQVAASFHSWMEEHVPNQNVISQC